MFTSKLPIREQLVYSTVRIVTQDEAGRTGVGTGFVAKLHEQEDGQHIPVLITNKHVVEGKAKVSFIFHEAADASSIRPKVRSRINARTRNGGAEFILHPEVDLAALGISDIIQQVNAGGKEVFYIAVGADALPSEDVLEGFGPGEETVMIGYPIGLWDSHNNMPIYRRGVAATNPAQDYEGRQEFLIDVATFPGSSGSPVFLLDLVRDGASGALMVGSQFFFLGVLYAMHVIKRTGEIVTEEVPTEQRPIAKTKIPVNLGVVIKASRVFEFEELIPWRGRTNERGSSG